LPIKRLSTKLTRVFPSTARRCPSHLKMLPCALQVSILRRKPNISGHQAFKRYIRFLGTSGFIWWEGESRLPEAGTARDGATLSAAREYCKRGAYFFGGTMYLSHVRYDEPKYCKWNQ